MESHGGLLTPLKSVRGHANEYDERIHYCRLLLALAQVVPGLILTCALVIPPESKGLQK